MADPTGVKNPAGGGRGAMDHKIGWNARREWRDIKNNERGPGDNEREREGETFRGGFGRLMRERWKEEGDVKRRKCGQKDWRGTRWMGVGCRRFLGQVDGGLEEEEGGCLLELLIHLQDQPIGAVASAVTSCN